MSDKLNQWRKDFPILAEKVYGKPLVYFDNAATTQKPLAVLNAMQEMYLHHYSNVHRGVHALSMQATALYEAARDKVQQFIHAKKREEIVFVRGTTEAINLVAQSFLRPRLQSGDEILITAMEHHANIVPWQLVCEQTGAILKVAPIDDQGEIILDAFVDLLSPRTRLVSVVHISNSLGTVNPVQKIVELAHQQGIPVLLDGAQAVAHQTVDVQALDCDFYAFSSHKMYGPTGIGVLYGKAEWLEKMPPYQGGGEMIAQVTFEKTTFNVIPHKFEAGTPAIVEAIGLAAAIEYLQTSNLEKMQAQEQKLLAQLITGLQKYSDIRLIGTAKEKTSIVSFVMADIHPHDVGTIMDQQGVAIRAGHHCTMPLMRRFQVPATARASLAFYNTAQEVDIFLAALAEVRAIFRRN